MESFHRNLTLIILLEYACEVTKVSVSSYCFENVIASQSAYTCSMSTMKTNELCGKQFKFQD